MEEVEEMLTKLVVRTLEYENLESDLQENRKVKSCLPSLVNLCRHPTLAIV